MGIKLVSWYLEGGLGVVCLLDDQGHLVEQRQQLPQAVGGVVGQGRGPGGGEASLHTITLRVSSRLETREFSYSVVYSGEMLGVSTCGCRSLRARRRAVAARREGGQWARLYSCRHTWGSVYTWVCES